MLFLAGSHDMQIMVVIITTFKNLVGPHSELLLCLLEPEVMPSLRYSSAVSCLRAAQHTGRRRFTAAATKCRPSVLLMDDIKLAKPVLHKLEQKYDIVVSAASYGQLS